MLKNKELAKNEKNSKFCKKIKYFYLKMIEKLKLFFIFCCILIFIFLFYMFKIPAFTEKIMT